MDIQKSLIEVKVQMFFLINFCCNSKKLRTSMKIHKCACIVLDTYKLRTVIIISFLKFTHSVLNGFVFMFTGELGSCVISQSSGK